MAENITIDIIELGKQLDGRKYYDRYNRVWKVIRCYSYGENLRKIMKIIKS